MTLGCRSIFLAAKCKKINLTITRLATHTFAHTDVDVTSYTHILNLSRAGRAARTGTRVARVARMILNNVVGQRKEKNQGSEVQESEETELKVGKVSQRMQCLEVNVHIPQRLEPSLTATLWFVTSDSPACIGDYFASSCDGCGHHAHRHASVVRIGRHAFLSAALSNSNRGKASVLPATPAPCKLQYEKL